MLLHGFPIAGNANNVFPALREEQVMIGLPSCASAAPSGGYIAPTEMKKALDYIMKGISYGGKYKIANQNGYLGFKGLMTWSVNWDAKSNFEFSTSYRSYFDGITSPVNKLQGATLSASAVDNGAYTLTAKVPANNTATSYKVMEGTTVASTGTLVAGNSTAQDITLNVTGKVAGTYNYTVEVSDVTASITSNQVAVTVPQPVVNTLKAPTLSASAVSNGAYILTAKVPANNTAISYKVMEGTTVASTGTLVAGNSTTQDIILNVTGKAAGTYNYTVEVSDATASITSNQVAVTVSQVVGNLPAKPSISYDNWNNGANFNIVMNMWWGENGTSWKLYENGVVVSTKALTANGQNAQTDSVSFTGKANGTYVYQAELVNAAGSTLSDKITYTVN